jgi:hypothetical protein
MINALVAKGTILIKYWFQPVLCVCSPRDALIRAFIETDSSFRHELDVERKFKKGGGTDWHPGCTATTALLVHDKLFVANAGDCRTIICRKGMAIPLSKVPVLVLSLTFLYCPAAEISTWTPWFSWSPWLWTLLLCSWRIQNLLDMKVMREVP